MSTHTTTTIPHVSATASPTRPERRRPGTAGYWLGVLVAILATLGALAWGAVTLLGWQSHVQEYPRLTSAGTVTASVTDPGTHVVYLEHDRSSAVPSVPVVTVTGPAGTELPVTPFGPELRYDVPDDTGRVGDAVLSFPADDPGTYRVTVGDLDPGATVAVGDNLVRGWAPRMVGSIALLLGGLLTGLVIVIVTAARRG